MPRQRARSPLTASSADDRSTITSGPPVILSEGQTPLRESIGATGDGAGLDHRAVEMRAYEIFCARGAVSGRPLDDWLQAEDELRRAQAGLLVAR